jgi:hypothetical protein
MRARYKPFDAEPGALLTTGRPARAPDGGLASQIRALFVPHRRSLNGRRSRPGRTPGHEYHADLRKRTISRRDLSTTMLRSQATALQGNIPREQDFYVGLVSFAVNSFEKSS